MSSPLEFLREGLPARGRKGTQMSVLPQSTSRLSLLAKVVLPLAVLLACLSWWSHYQHNPLSDLELRCLDYLFVTRHALHGPEPVDPRVVIVAIDEATFEAVGKPTVLWGTDYAQLVAALKQAGAASVGLDVIVSFSAGQVPELQPLVERAENDMAEVIFNHQLVIIQLAGDKLTDLSAHSSQAIVAAASAEALEAIANVIRDNDGLYRRFPLVFQEGQVMVFFARMLELGTGKSFKLNGDQVFFDDRRVVTELPGPTLRFNVPGPPGTIPSVSMAGLIERVRKGEPLSEFKDKMVFIGPAAPSMQDYRPTAFLLKDQQHLGIELHAAAANTVLTQRYIRPLPAAMAAGLAFLGVLVVGLLAASFSTRIAVLSFLGLGFSYLLTAEELFTRLGLWLPIAVPAIGGLLGLSGGYLVRYLAVNQYNRLVKELFGRMVDPQVMGEVLRHPDFAAFGGVRQEVTIFFSDINNFTPMCEGHAPVEVIQMLNDYFGEMVRIIRAQKGTLKQFVGDEIMVIFGAPGQMHDHAARAVETGLLMRERLAELSAQAGGKDGFYDVKIGIHTGQVVMGYVGSELRSEYAAVGDVVNLAARIEATTKKLGADILVSKATKEAAEKLLPGLEWTSMGLQEFKGKTERVELFSVRRRGLNIPQPAARE